MEAVLWKQKKIQEINNMIYVIGIFFVVAIIMAGLVELNAPMPPPKPGSYAEYLSDEERLGIQSNADWELAKKLAKERGWKME